jgi:hypothetical protein
MEHPSYNIPTRNRAIQPAEFIDRPGFRSAAAIMTTSELRSYFPDTVIAITGFLLSCEEMSLKILSKVVYAERAHPV